MENIDDLLGTMDSGDTAFQNKPEPKKEYGGNTGGNSWNKGGFNKGGFSNKPKEIDYWDKKDITPIKINPNSFTSTKAFTIAFPRDLDIPELILKFFTTITELLTSKGYIYRFGAAGDNKIQKILFDIAEKNKNIEVLLPWKKFNEDAAGTEGLLDVQIRPNATAYGVAVNLNQSFYKLSPHVRAMNARDAQLMLGKDCTKPNSMLVIYTECGSEAIKGKMDWKKITGLSLMLSIAEEANITVYNLKNEESRKKLSEKLKALATPPVPVTEDESI